MARIKSKTIEWDPSPDSDVTKYVVYVSQGDTADPYTGVTKETQETHVKVPDDFPDGTFDVEGNYVVQVVAVDDQGNEADPAVITVPFDFHPPAPVTNLRVV